MFLKKRLINDTLYWSLVESYREEGKVKQRIFKNLGNTAKAIEMCKTDNTLLPYLEQILGNNPDNTRLPINTILHGNALKKIKEIPNESVHTCVTSPPYWGLRDYGVKGQLGLEKTPEEYVRNLVKVFREVRRVLRNDGTLWLNLGDSYAGSGKGQWEEGKGQKEVYIPTKDSPQCKMNKVPSGMKPKDLVGIPWTVALALRADGWYLRSDIIWEKPNAMPESVTDRPTKAHEYLFLLSKSKKYYYDADAIKEPAQKWTGQSGTFKRKSGKATKLTVPGQIKVSHRENRSVDAWALRPTRNRRTVWSVPTKPFSEAHFAVFPPELVEPCILAGSPRNGIVLDPFFGSGTTGLVALENSRNFIGIELNDEYIHLANSRLGEVQLKMEFN